MQIGAVYPQIELRGDPSAVRRFGLAVEELGFDYLLAYDHVLGAVHADRTPRLTGPYTEHDPFHDPFVMFAYLAAITERINFATGVLWDLGLRGLARHLASGDTLDPDRAAAWSASGEGKEFVSLSSQSWCAASVAAGADPSEARAAAERTTAFYAGTSR